MLNCGLLIEKENAEPILGSFEKHTKIYKGRGWVIFRS